MVSPFEIVITKMWELGFFHFLLYLLTSAVFYGLLRKSKLFGEPRENVAVNGVVAFVASLMVWAYPVIIGVDIVRDFIIFFTQGLIAFLIVLVGLLMVSMFLPPGLPEELRKIGFGRKFYGSLILIFLLVGLGILISSGLSNVLFPPVVVPPIAPDIIIIIGVILLFIVTIAVIIYIGGR